MGLIENYVDTVRRETGMFGVYPPNQRIRLGDFGFVKDGRFVRHGNIHNLDSSIPVREIVSSAKMNREFKSRKTRKTVIGAGASGSAGADWASQSPSAFLSCRRRADLTSIRSAASMNAC